MTQDENNPVVLSVTMGCLSPNVLESWWLRDRCRFDLVDWTLHELRHSYISALALKGVHPKVMQELAGLASSQITMDIYTHINMWAKHQAGEAIVDIFDAPPRRRRSRPSPQTTPASFPEVVLSPSSAHFVALKRRPGNSPVGEHRAPFVPDSHQTVAQ